MKLDNQRMVEEADADNADIDDPTMETHIFLQHLMVMMSNSLHILINLSAF
jgi:hypothetical protein